MARLAFCDYHNMITILEKYEHNYDFHQIVDFVEASHIRYALTFNPTVYVSHIRQFWSTARIVTTKEGTKILATVDGTLTEPHHTPTHEATPSPQHELSSSSLPLVTTESLPTVIPTDNPPLRQYTRRTTIAQSLVLSLVADEPASPLGDDSQGEACLTNSGFRTDQDRANIDKPSTLLSDSTPRVTSLAADEAQELEITILKARVKLLEDREGKGIEQSGDDFPIKGRSLNEGEEAAERVSDDTKEMAIIARDAEIARIHAEEELQMLIDGLDRNNETVAKYLQEYYQFAAELPIESKIELISWKARYFKGMALEEIKEKFDPVWNQFQDFIPIGSKEEAERFKRKGVREDFNQLWALVKETLNIRPATSNKEMELWVELKRLYEPDVEDQLWTHTQNLMHALVEWKLYDTCEVHHVTSKDKEIFMLVEKDYPLRKDGASSLREDYWDYNAQGIPTGSDEFPLPEQLPTAYEDKFPLLIQSNPLSRRLHCY
nr:hypothetical protein [Tanacetum cinerariifolium]